MNLIPEHNYYLSLFKYLVPESHHSDKGAGGLFKKIVEDDARSKKAYNLLRFHNQKKGELLISVLFRMLYIPGLVRQHNFWDLCHILIR